MIQHTPCYPEALRQIGMLLLDSASGKTDRGLYNIGRSAPPEQMSPEEYSKLLEMPLWQMSGAQFVTLSESVMSRFLSVLQNEPEKRYVYGIEGLAKLIGKSVNTAQRLKSSGAIDDAIIQHGRTIMIDADLALRLLQEQAKETERRKTNGG